MKTCGIIAEYNPFHKGHAYHIQQTRALLGEDCGIVCVMSGNFVQRGAPALFPKHTRAAAALQSGADLVLELPLPFAMAPAERFASKTIQILDATGVVDFLSFGSECGRLSKLEEIARGLHGATAEPLLQTLLNSGCSYPKARQETAFLLLGQKAGLLQSPNNLLGVSYLGALQRLNSSIVPLTIPRRGACHDGGVPKEQLASASHLRALLTAGKPEAAAPFLPSETQELYEKDLAAGIAPATATHAERAILAKLRTMAPEDYEALPESGGGLAPRLMASARAGSSLKEILDICKTKRYTHAHLRRLILWAFLGVAKSSRPNQIPYLRVLGFNGTGRKILAKMRTSARLPVITKPARAKQLSQPGRMLFELESRSTDLYSLCSPRIYPGGEEWRRGPVLPAETAQAKP